MSLDPETAAMELPLVRRRSISTPKPHKLEEEEEKDQSIQLVPPPRRSCPQFLIMVVVLILLNIWCSFLFVNSFHFCVSSLKTDIYCIYGGTGTNSRFDQLARHPLSALASKLHPKEAASPPADASKPESRDPADQQQQHVLIKTPEENLRSIDHATNNTSTAVEQQQQQRNEQSFQERLRVKEEGRSGGEGRKSAEKYMAVLRSWAAAPENYTRVSSCEGKGIFVYDLPSKFNKDVLAECAKMLPWKSLCKFLENEGKGQPVPELGKAWYNTHQYSLEPVFYSRVLNHPCRVQDPAAAKLFYVPFFGGLNVLRWHFKNVSNDVKDALGMELVRWLEDQPTWTRNAGEDHMFVLGKISWDFRRIQDSPWGSNFLLLNQMKNPKKLLIERNPWELNEIGIPHPTFFHPHGDSDIDQWQSNILSSKRSHLVSFVGAPREEAAESIRTQLINQCTSKKSHCLFLNCNTGGCSRPENVIAVFKESEFCLQPAGDSPTRKSVFDSLVAGCIPVFFSRYTAYLQYPWHLPEDSEKYSVFMAEEEVRQGKVDIVERLMSFSAEKKEEMRRYIALQIVPSLVYGDSTAKFNKYRDASEVALDNLINKITKSSD